MADPARFRAALNNPSKDHGRRFAELIAFLQATGWKLRIKGVHHILTRPGVA